MNNFVFGNTDPLLYSNLTPRGQEYINEPDIKRQLDSVMQQYQQLQQSKPTEVQTKDWIGDFDNTLKNLDADVADTLSNDAEFIQLNNSIQQDIQNEIMVTIKWKLNNRPETVQRIKRLMDIIDNHNKNKANEDKKHLAEISDYIQNYSDMTFNDYKKLKEANK